VNIPIQVLDDGIPIPQRSLPGDAGVDLSARVPAKLASGARATIATGIAVAIPEGFAGLIVPRSGIAARHGISVVNGPGLIDAGYRGEINVVLVNLGKEPFTIERGDRIAQLVVIPVADQDYTVVDELPPSARGSDGFGSTGR
jgi:dUTP pyrophosphatase